MLAIVYTFAVFMLFDMTFGFVLPSNMMSAPRTKSTIVMDGKTRVLRDRIKSVKNTRRITEAMRLVAAARVRRAQDAVLKSRPLIAQLQLVYKSVLKACDEEEIQLPILEVRDVKTVALVLVTGDRGLCGGYNSQVIKSAQERINKLTSQGINVKLVLVGRKGEQWFGKRPTPIAATFVLGNVPQASVGSQLANFLVAQFLTREVDAAEIIYTRFKNLISSEPSIRTLLPLSLTGIEAENDEVFMMTSKDGKLVLQSQGASDANTGIAPDYIFEDEPAEILNSMLTLFFSATVMRCMQESVASELASRMTAMQSASNNAKKIGTMLSQKYNRARQATVTQEILEISAGASAMAE